MIPGKEDYPIIDELERMADHLEEYGMPGSGDLADLLRRAAEEIYVAHYSAWESAMGEDL